MMANQATQAEGAMLMAMGMMALMQSGADNGASGQSGQTAAASDATTTASTASATDTPTAGPQAVMDGGKAAAFASPAGQQAIAAIQAAGGDVTSAGVTM